MLLVESQYVHPKKRNFIQYCQSHHIQPASIKFEDFSLRQQLKPFIEKNDNNLKIIVNDEKSIVEKEYREFNQYLGEVYLQNQSVQKQKIKDKLINGSQKNDIDNICFQQKNSAQVFMKNVDMDIEEYNETEKYKNSNGTISKNSYNYIIEKETKKQEQEIANNVYEYYRQQKEELMKAIESRQQKMLIEN